MKATRIILLTIIASSLTSCNAPLVQRVVGLPGNIIQSVAEPIFGTLF